MPGRPNSPNHAANAAAWRARRKTQGINLSVKNRQALRETLRHIDVEAVARGRYERLLEEIHPSRMLFMLADKLDESNAKEAEDGYFGANKDGGP